MPIAVTAEQQALHESVLAYGQGAGAIAAVRAQERGDPAWRRLWPGLVDLGLTGIAVPEELGGAGGTVVDLAVALEAAAEALIPGPILPTALAGLVLADQPGVRELLPAVVGGLPAAVALSPGTLTAQRDSAGRLLVTGVTGPVLGASADAVLLVPVGGETGWILLTPGEAGVRLLPATDFSRDLAEVEVVAVVPTDRVLPDLSREAVLDRAVVLAAAEAAGIARWCVYIASRYAREREQFGRPIGSFQAVKHLCAEMLCRSERAAAVAWDAARAVEEASPAMSLSAAAAGAVALDAAVANAKDCVQVLGGIGFTWEHDAHLYLRRAFVLRQWVSGVRWRGRAAVLAGRGVRRRLRVEVGDGGGQGEVADGGLGGVGRARVAGGSAGQGGAGRVGAGQVGDGGADRVDSGRGDRGEAGGANADGVGLGTAGGGVAGFGVGGAAGAGVARVGSGVGGGGGESGFAAGGDEGELGVGELRGRVRAAAERIAALAEGERRGALVAAGLFAPQWPAPYGLGLGAVGQLVVEEELARVGVGRADLVIGGWAAPTVLRHGTDEQRRRFVAATLRGEVRWCQLFSEPGAGSDLASLRTRAVRTDGGWLLSGQKVWTSLADRADRGICLARTDSEVPRHRGLTYFLVDMRSDGISVRPLREITGDTRFAEVFLDEVFVADADVVGQPGDGWRLARGTLADERVAMSRGSALGEPVEEVLAFAERAGLLADPVLAERVGGLVVDGLALSLLDLRATQRAVAGGEAGAESGVRKLVGVRHRQDVAEVAAELLGDGAAVGDAAEVHRFLLSRCLSIAGGTTQVLLTMVGERVLGLPRDGAVGEGKGR
ncbi:MULTISPECIES: acyl-CoA dehydrogenase [unclassified Crossiella]|uniref:acyl-CoA dehydrogenase family protein n=1 Tax=unclassified Crossiella TaxID=2620835 RepID=UPI001FFFB1A1|nr:MULTISPECIES: acyl-CoA dehydrogenase [unclassified Crossiella]MCK2239530.1 acyl-CoA dehydrogenase [Crossiella sp. S99.2]MCK2252225.1 acyl-CoA dehydrogenase [Crossiella sp. S99.1]